MLKLAQTVPTKVKETVKRDFSCVFIVNLEEVIDMLKKTE